MAESNFTTQMPDLPVIDGVSFRHVPNWPGYAVGDDGSVWSCKRPGGYLGERKRFRPWKQLTLILDVDGYPFVNLIHIDRRQRIKMCILVLTSFIGPRPIGMECRHFPDRTRTNNKLSNLRWGTNSENKQDAVRDGTCALLRNDIRFNGQYSKAPT